MESSLAGRGGPFVAATDYMRTFADQIRPFVPGRYAVLGTDGFGRSDYRVKLRSFFEVDRHHVAVDGAEGARRRGRRRGRRRAGRDRALRDRPGRRAALEALTLSDTNDPQDGSSKP